MGIVAPWGLRLDGALPSFAGTRGVWGSLGGAGVTSDALLAEIRRARAEGNELKAADLERQYVKLFGGAAAGSAAGIVTAAPSGRKAPSGGAGGAGAGGAGDEGAGGAVPPPPASSSGICPWLIVLGLAAAAALAL